MKTTKEPAEKTRSAPDIDEALDAEAQGYAPTSDDAEAADDEDLGEIDAIGAAAGIPVGRTKPVGGPDEIARRDAHRWELDPASAEDAKTRKP